MNLTEILEPDHSPPDYTFDPWSENSTYNNNSDFISPTIELIFALHRPKTLLGHKIVTIIFWCIGFPGNILSFMVWIRPSLLPSSGIYMAALAMTDLVFLLFHVLFELQASWYIRTVEYPFLCQTFPLLYISSQHLSVLLVGAFTVERYISICHPFQREKICTTRRALYIVFSLITFSLGLNAVQAYFWSYDSEKHECGIRYSVLSQTPSVWEIWSWSTELFIFGIVPLAILIINILVLVEMRRIKAKQLQTMSQPQKPLRRNKSILSRHRSRSGGPSATTVMLMTVSFYLIAVTLPVTFTYVLQPAFPVGNHSLTLNETLSDPQWVAFCNFWGVKVIIQDIGLSHFALNFIIYVSTGRIFRNELCGIFDKCPCPGFHKIQRLFCWRRQNQVSDHHNTRTSLVNNRNTIKRHTEENGNGIETEKF